MGRGEVDRSFVRWSARVRPGEEEQGLMRREVRFLRRRLVLSLLVVVADEDEIWIKATANSVLAQLYPDVELCVCDNASARPHVRDVLQRLAASDDRVKAHSLPERVSRARAWDGALSLSSGEYVGVLDPGDELPPEVLFEAVGFLNRSGADLLYTDEVEVDLAGRPLSPVFKPPWSLDLLLATDYVGRMCLFHRSVLEEAGGFREGSGDAEHDLKLRFAEKAGRAVHLPGAFCHRRGIPGEPPGLAPSVGRALRRRGVQAAVEPGPRHGALQVVRSLPEGLSVSLIVAGDADETGLRVGAGYPVHEVLAAGEGTPAGALNRAARSAGGDYLVFLGEQVSPVSDGWLAELLRHVVRPEVGVVGGRLVSAAGKDVRTDRALNLTALTVREPRGEGPLPPDLPFSFPPSAGFMAMRREVFLEVGGFDEASFPDAFYGLDLGFRLEKKGLLNLHEPRARAEYRGGLRRPGEGEIAYLWSRRWAEVVRALYYSGSPVEQCEDRAALETVRGALLSGKA